MEKIISKRVVLLFGITAMIVFALLMKYVPEYGMWGEAIFVLFGFLAVIFAIDVYGLPKINLVEEIVRNGNRATAILVSAIIIAFSIVIHGFATR